MTEMRDYRYPKEIALFDYYKVKRSKTTTGGIGEEDRPCGGGIFGKTGECVINSSLPQAKRRAQREKIL